jgi:hypothetical protein
LPARPPSVQASRSTKLPLNPLLARRVSAVPEVCRASAEFSSRLAALDEVPLDEADVLEDEVVEPVDELVELPVPDVLEVDEEEPDADEPDDVLAEPPDVVVGVVAVKKLFPAPNPTLGA